MGFIASHAPVQPGCCKAWVWNFSEPWDVWCGLPMPMNEVPKFRKFHKLKNGASLGGISTLGMGFIDFKTAHGLTEHRKHECATSQPPGDLKWWLTHQNDWCGHLWVIITIVNLNPNEEPEMHPAQQMPGKCCKKASICQTLVFCTCRMWENPPEFLHLTHTWGSWAATWWFASRWLTFGHFVISGNWWVRVTLIGHNDPRGHDDHFYHTVSERSAPQL